MNEAKNKAPRTEEKLLEEAGWAFSSVEARDLMDAISRGELDYVRCVIRRKSQYFSADEVEILVQRLVRDEATDRKRYPDLVTTVGIMQLMPRDVNFQAVFDLLDSSEAPKALGRLSRDRVWRQDEIVPWIKTMLKIQDVLKS